MESLKLSGPSRYRLNQAIAWMLTNCLWGRIQYTNVTRYRSKHDSSTALTSFFQSQKPTMLNLKEDSLDWALTHVENFGDTEFFPVPFEFKAIRHDWARLRPYLASQDLDTWNVRDWRKCLAPKHRFGFRNVTQLDPLDTLIYTALVFEIGLELETLREPAENGVVHSWRFLGGADGQFFSRDYSYSTFTDKCRELANRSSWVVIADIADFFPRIYSHPLDNALTQIPSADHARVLKKMFAQWNYTVSYGIPVGTNASRLLSELVITDVDQALLSEGIQFCRFSDDFRLFAHSEREAHDMLVTLAETLFENHGLTLQQTKTRVQRASEFLGRIDDGGTRSERESLFARFEQLVSELGINWYEPIPYEDLSSEVQEAIGGLNLNEILESQIALGNDADMGICQFALKRLSQLDNADSVDLALDSIGPLYPVFKDVMEYFQSLRRLDPIRKSALGARLFELAASSVVGHLPFHRLWLFSVFTHNREWNNESKLVELFSQYVDEFSRRELILAMGRSHIHHWFKTRKREYQSTFRTWERRAFLVAMSCLPGDEATHWYRSVMPRLDELEKAVVNWAKQNRF